jgi:hypothetical protein
MNARQNRKALIVGIDYYAHMSKLFGCVSDAHKVEGVLKNHGDAKGSVNFKTPAVLTASDITTTIPRSLLKDKVEALFAGQHEIALFYFAGHGHIEATGGYICGSDCKRGDDGLALGEVMALANKSPSTSRIIVLDSCFSGIAGTRSDDPRTAELKEGTSILTASADTQYASEENGGGVFTELFVDALMGAAGNLVGDVTPGSVYAHIDESLGPWRQRPIFKTNVTNFVSLRTVKPPIELDDLRQLKNLFPHTGFRFKLDPSFEPESAGRPDGAPSPNVTNTEIFSVLQRFNRVNLLVPVEAPHMWHAAMQSKSCRLTPLGEHYRRLVVDGLLG